jgi:hypothetical protein
VRSLVARREIGHLAGRCICDAYHTDAQSIARSVTWRIGTTGEIITEEAQVIVLACSTVETPRLWFNSGLPNPNGSAEV